LPKPPSFIHVPSSEKKQEDKVEKLILNTINSRNITKINALFSKNARSQINDLDNKIAKFLEFYQGEYVSSVYANAIMDHYDNGNDENMFDFLITVTTDKEIYVIDCKYIISNPKIPENIGVYRMEIIKSANAESSVSWHDVSDKVPDVKCHDN
jgi:hypothetical protein